MIRLALLLAMTGPSAAELVVESRTYLCERGVQIPATYATELEGDGQAIAVVHVEGRQITLQGEEAASGTRYGWPSGGSSYVWWVKGQDALLIWKNGASGEETVLLAD